MTQDDRDILEVLKFELSFLEDGGFTERMYRMRRQRQEPPGKAS